jgi:thiol-disulfide isomerase/thioredoxin
VTDRSDQPDHAEPRADRPANGAGNRVPVVVGVVVALVVAIGLAVLLTGGDDDSETGPVGSSPAESVDPGGDDGATEGTSGAGDGTDDGGGEEAVIPPIFDGEVFPVAVEGTALAPLEDPASDPAIGQPAPVLTGSSFDGSTVVVGGPSDGPTIVVFLAHWCPHCNDEVPELLQLEEEGRFPEGLRVVGVSTGVAPDRPDFPPSTWLADFGWPFESMADGIDTENFVFQAATAYGVSAFPFVTVLDADGTVLTRWSGASGADTIEQRLTTALTQT